MDLRGTRREGAEGQPSDADVGSKCLECRTSLNIEGSPW